MDDHRKLGRELGLFGTDPLIGAGLPYWLPADAALAGIAPHVAAHRSDLWDAA
jgi:threonyl-tRNA synthetase